MSASGLLALTSRCLFFTGKGGVGKTSLAAATAVSLADAGKAVLLVSTDPASNLDEILGIELRNTPVSVPGADNLQRRAHIEPWAWVVNRSVLAAAP